MVLLTTSFPVHNMGIDSGTFLDKVLLKKWNPKIPYFWSGDTIYAQSIEHSLKSCNKKNKLNFNKLYAHLLLYERKSIIKNINPILQSVKTNFFNLYFIIFWYMIYFVKRVINYLTRKIYPSKYYLVYKNIKQIDKCVDIIESH